MFGKSDNQPQQDPVVNDGVMQAAMPDPLASTINNDATSNGSSFITPANSPAAPPSSDFGSSDSSATAPALPSDSTTPEDNTDVSSTSPANAPDSDELIKLKQQALQQLSPLVSHLDQTPEEKFRTTMMMIQASDDQTLVKSALEAAQTITDDKARAQALLDVINEINYFSQHQS